MLSNKSLCICKSQADFLILHQTWKCDIFAHILEPQKIMLADRALKDTQSILLHQSAISNTYVTPY